MKKRILFIHQHYFPEMAGTARRTKELAEGLYIKGHICTVLTSYPRIFRSIPGYKASDFEIINGVRVFRLKTHFEVKINVLFRMISYLIFFIKSALWMYKYRKKFDLAISIAPLASGMCGALAQKYFKLPHHFDVPDILPDLGISAGMIRNKLLIKVLYNIERWVYDNSTTISAITEGQVKNIEKKGVNSDKIYLFPDWVDVEFFLINAKKHNQLIHDQINKHNRYKIISFIGNIGALQGVESFLDLARLLNDDAQLKYKFLFIGDGIMLDTLQKRVKKEQILNVEFIGRVPRELVPSYMNQSDILVANYLNNPYMDICIPGKTYEYLVSNRPILIGSRGESAKLVQKFNAGIAVEPMNPHEMKKAIYTILQNPKLFEIDLEKFISLYKIDAIIEDYNNMIIKKYSLNQEK